MATNPPQPTGRTEPPASERLDSWKEIAAYLKRDESTVRRWQKEGLPVHRRPHKSKASVYAYKSEIDLWWNDGRAPVAPTEAEPADRRGATGLLAGVGGVAAGCLLLALGLGLNVGGLRDRMFGPGVGEIASIAVVPLKNVSGDPEQDYLAEGMTEMLITELGKVGALRVISHQSVIRYRHTTKSLPEIARELDADALLEGSVLQSGNKVRITINLVQAVPERHLLSESYEGNLRNVLGVQADIARAVAVQTRITLSPQENAQQRSSRPVDPEAYEAYLKGRVQFSKATVAGRRRAREQFEKAIEKDPGFARAYASLAELYARGTSQGPAAGESRALARQFAAKALELDESLSEAHTALAWVEVTDWRWDAAEREFRRAIELNPSYPLARVWYALYLSALGRFEQAISEGKQAQRLDPLSPDLNTHVGWAYLFANRTDEAMRIWREVLELEPNDWAACHQLGRGYLAKGMYREAIVEFKKALALDAGNAFDLGMLAHAYGRAGRREEALKFIGELERRTMYENVPRLPLIWAYAGVGDTEKAFAWLEKAYGERRSGLVYLNVDPLFDPLRSDPRFENLVRRVGLPAPSNQVRGRATKLDG